MVPVFFVHLPKTGGSTLTSALKQQFRADRIFACDRLITPSFFTQNQNEMLQADLITGHCGFGAAEKIRQAKEIKTISVIRNPKDHLISIFLHICRDTPSMYDYGIRNFIRSYVYYSAFQSGSLLSAFSGFNNIDCRIIEKYFGNVLDIIDNLDYISSLEQLCAEPSVVANVINLSRELELDKLNVASNYDNIEDVRSTLAAQYEEAIRDPRVSYFVDLDNVVYKKAKSRFLDIKNRIQRGYLRKNTEHFLDGNYCMFESGNVKIVAEKNWKISTQENGQPCWWTGENPDSYFLLYVQKRVIIVEFDVIVDHFVSIFQISSLDALVEYEELKGENRNRRLRLLVTALETFIPTMISIRLELDRTPAAVPKSPPWVPSFAIGNFIECPTGQSGEARGDKGLKR